MPYSGDRGNTNTYSVPDAFSNTNADTVSNAHTLSDGDTNSISAACNNKNQVRF